MVWRSPISALQVGMVKNVKFNHEFLLFFAQILHKNDTVCCSNDLNFRINFLGNFVGMPIIISILSTERSPKVQTILFLGNSSGNITI